MFALLSGGASTAASITDILKMATEMFKFFIEEMGNLVNFIFGNPAILIMFLILICGAVVGMFSRVWHSV
ncbi:MAG: hypothetical protein NC123_04390 [Butyrivibrio sp.]|nr:hypothetical protein [Acetatifactor muris]MCM1558767.1 hypothetical protein [Butyrivibrio sp.]